MISSTRSRIGAGALALAASAAIAIAGCSSDTGTASESASSVARALSGSAAVSHPTRPADTPQVAPPTPGAGTDPGGDIDTGQSPPGAAGSSAAASSGPSGERPVDPNEPSAAGTFCGDGYNGLAVFTFGPDCPTAMTVQAAFGARLAAGDTGTFALDAAGQRWICGEGTAPVPYLECSSNIGAVRLAS